MNKDQIINEIMNSPSKKVKLAAVDLDGVLRGKYIHLDKFKSAIEGGFGFCDVVFGWDVNDLCYENNEGMVTGWHTGYPDAPCDIDFSTFRKVPWDSDVPFFLVDFTGEKTRDLCPRTILKKTKAKANSMGFDPFFSAEFEWFNFRENMEELNDRDFRNPNPVDRGMFGYSILRANENKEYLNELFDQMSDFNVPIEGIHTETGPGVYEAAILYSDIVEAADRATLFKSGAKELGRDYGIIPTFMAKWNEKLPGSSGHIHQSLWRDGKNVFFGGDIKYSETMKHYMAGILHCLPELLPMYAPTINSYKRLVEGMWAPTTLTWGEDNRTCALRAIPGSPKSSRIEMRVTGADINPYLAMSACLASGLYGIENELELPTETKGNGYEDFSNGTLPKTLLEASNKMKSSKLARSFFGDHFVDHFCFTREWEWKQYMKAVTNWELKRYFEII